MIGGASMARGCFWLIGILFFKPIGSTGLKWIQMGSNWSKLVQRVQLGPHGSNWEGSKGSKWVQIGQQKKVHVGQHGFKWVQMGPKGSTWVHRVQMGPSCLGLAIFGQFWAGRSWWCVKIYCSMWRGEIGSPKLDTTPLDPSNLSGPAHDYLAHPHPISVIL